MGIVRRRPAFKQDLADVWRFIADDSVSRADRLLSDLEDKFQLLADMPLIGVRKFRNRPELRVFPYRNHLIVYQAAEDDRGVELIRLLHGARDWRRLFEDEEK